MKLLSEKEVLENKDFIISEMKAGKIFIYPTNTVYGMGCDASNSESVKKVYDIKKRENKSVLIIVPSENWIDEKCHFNKEYEKELKENISGAFSYIVNLKNLENISGEVLQGRETIGIRKPENFFTELISEANMCFVTTSVNISGEKAAVKINEISEEIINQVDYVVESDEELLGKSSEIYDITGEEKIRLR